MYRPALARHRPILVKDPFPFPFPPVQSGCTTRPLGPQDIKSKVLYKGEGTTMLISIVFAHRQHPEAQSLYDRLIRSLHTSGTRKGTRKTSFRAIARCAPPTHHTDAHRSTSTSTRRDHSRSPCLSLAPSEAMASPSLSSSPTMSATPAPGHSRRTAHCPNARHRSRSAAIVIQSVPCSMVSFFMISSAIRGRPTRQRTCRHSVCIARNTSPPKKLTWQGVPGPYEPSAPRTATIAFAAMISKPGSFWRMSSNFAWCRTRTVKSTQPSPAILLLRIIIVAMVTCRPA